jgi:sigma-E factor negative regulatory protein RseC
VIKCTSLVRIDLNNYKNQSNLDNYIEHQGTVSRISNDTLTVTLQGNIHCEGCKAQSACGVSDSNDKEIEVPINDSYQINEPVKVLMQRQLGMQAVFWAYLFPFILLVSVLFISVNFVEEWLAGVLALAILIPYFVILYLTKSLFKKVFEVTVLKTIV